MSKLNEEYKKAMDIVMGCSMDDLLNIVINKRDNAMDDLVHFHDRRIVDPMDFAGLEGQIKAYNDVISVIESIKKENK